MTFEKWYQDVYLPEQHFEPTAKEKSGLRFAFEEGKQTCAERKNVVIEQLEFNIDEYNRLTREIDSIISDDPAKQASLCDLVEPIKQLKDKCEQQAKELSVFRKVLSEIRAVANEFVFFDESDLEGLLLSNNLIDEDRNPTSLLTEKQK